MTASTQGLLDRFMPRTDVRGRHEITIHAPCSVVMDVARNFQIESLFIVRTLFRIRFALLGAAPQPQQRLGLVEQMEKIGWSRLEEERDSYLVAGAACRPWNADPAFTPVTAEQFATFAGPDLVKIVWTLEATPLAPALTRFATETRAVATDEPSRVKFRRYWRKFGAGIILIRLVLLPALRRQAERQWRERKRAA